MRNQSSFKKKGLTIKDLITIGIFSALLIVAIFIGSILFGPNPVLTFYVPLGSALLGGPILMLLIAKVPKKGGITTVGILCGVIMFATGMHWTMSLGYSVGGIVGDYIGGIKQYKSRFNNVVAYICICLGSTWTYISFFMDPEGWSKYMLNGGTSESYLDAMNAAAYNWMLAVILVGTILIATLSAIFGQKLVKKQFEKAGITA